MRMRYGLWMHGCLELLLDLGLPQGLAGLSVSGLADFLGIIRCGMLSLALPTLALLGLERCF